MYIRNAELRDLNQIKDIYAHARQFMKETGNPNQWFDYYPREEIIIDDINKRLNYVFVEDDRVVGVMAFIIGKDPTYSYIEGKWLNDEKYGTIHRIASISSGVFDEAVKFASKKVPNIRIDTHKDNIVMQHLILKNDFTYCGIIYCHDGTPRLAYQKKAG